MIENKNKEVKSSVDFSNYNPYYKDISEYIKACNKARLMYREIKDIEPFYTAIDILINTTFPYIRSKNIIHIKDKLSIKEDIFKILDYVGDFMPSYRIMKKKVYKENVPNKTKEAFIIKENEILNTLSKVQRNIIKDLSYFKILPRVSIDYIEEDEDGLAFN